MFKPTRIFTCCDQVLFVLAWQNYDPTAEYPTACDYPTKEEHEDRFKFGFDVR